MIISMISDLSVEVWECEDGADAHDAYAYFQPDIVLMDLAMPGVDGFTATRRITAEYPEAKIIIVTSHDGAAMRETARSAGACDFLLKENIAQLRDILTACPAEADSLT